MTRDMRNPPYLCLFIIEPNEEENLLEQLEEMSKANIHAKYNLMKYYLNRLTYFVSCFVIFQKNDKIVVYF